MTNSSEIRPFRIDIPQAALDDLRDRLARTRWANELEIDYTGAVQTGPLPPEWEYGVPQSYVRRLAEQWLTSYDWRKWEERLNSYPQYVTEIDGQNVHFFHVRSTDPDAIPLILTHGWPNTSLEYFDLIEPLTSPKNGEQAFHLVIPTVPGFGFSGHTRDRGWNRYRVAAAWAELMRRLGYERYGAHGNDGGSYVSPEVGRVDPEHVIGVHVTQLFSFPSGDPAELENLSEEEQGYLQFLQYFNENLGAYAKLQEQAPQNVGHALADSPTGQLAWIAQLLSSCSDEHVLTNATIYWLTNTGASSARFYYEDKHADHPKEPTTTPTALAGFAFDFRPLRRFAERDHANIVSWHEFDRGSHWATQDAPDLLAEDLRGFFGALS